MNKKYKHLFFDLDHTLWDFEANSKATLELVFNNFSLEKNNIQFDDFFENYKIQNDIFWERYRQGIIKSDELKWKRIWQTLLLYNIENEEWAKEIANFYLVNLPLQNKVFDYTFEILNYLKANNYHLHVITNGFENVQLQKLHNSNLFSYFDIIVCSENLNFVKPQKEIFDYAVSKANAQMNECIMLGDSPESDLQGAVNSNMDSVYINHENKTSIIKYTFEVNNLKELFTIF